MTILANPIGEMNLPTDKLPYLFRTGMRAMKWEDKWMVCKKTLDALHSDLGGIKDHWAEVQLVPTGSKYTSKKDQKMYDEMTFKFIRIFKTEDECIQAYRAVMPKAAPASADDIPFDAKPNAVNNDREVALKFLKVLVPQWCKDGLDPDKVRAGLAANPVLAKHFTPDSPEVMELMMSTVKA